jgi:hypothetical protein
MNDLCPSIIFRLAAGSLKGSEAIVIRKSQAQKCLHGRPLAGIEELFRAIPLKLSRHVLHQPKPITVDLLNDVRPDNSTYELGRYFSESMRRKISLTMKQSTVKCRYPQHSSKDVLINHEYVVCQPSNAHERKELRMLVSQEKRIVQLVREPTRGIVFSAEELRAKVAKCNDGG